jgi:hypothetical protein
MTMSMPTHRCANCGVLAVGTPVPSVWTAGRTASVRFHGTDGGPLGRCAKDPLSRIFGVHAMERVRD